MNRKWRLQELGSGLLLVIAGLILALVPGLALTTIANIIGIFMILIGVFFTAGYIFRPKAIRAWNYDLVTGLITLCIGIFICSSPEFVVSILPVLLGFSVVISGIIKLQRGFDLKRLGIATWFRIIITGLISIIFGCIAILDPFTTVAWLVRFIGVGLVFSGITDMITIGYISKRASDYYVDGTVVEGKVEEDDDKDNTGNHLP